MSEKYSIPLGSRVRTIEPARTGDEPKGMPEVIFDVLFAAPHGRDDNHTTFLGYRTS